MRLIRRIKRVCIVALLLAMAFMIGLVVTFGIIEVAKSPPVPTVLGVLVISVIVAALMNSIETGVFFENIVKLGTGIRGAPSNLQSDPNHSASMVPVTGASAHVIRFADRRSDVMPARDAGGLLVA